MSCSMDHCPECHGVSDLSVEPDVFIGREEPSEFRTDDTDDIAQHWNENQTAVKRKDKPSTTRNPDRPFETVEDRKLLIRLL